MTDDLKKLAEALRKPMLCEQTLVDVLDPIAKLHRRRYRGSLPRDIFEAWLDGAVDQERFAAADAIEALIRERDEASALAEQATYKALALEGRAEAAEAALSAAREEVARLLSAMKREEDYLLRMIEAEDETGGLMVGDVQGAFHRIRDKDSDDLERADEAATLTKETTDD